MTTPMAKRSWKRSKLSCNRLCLLPLVVVLCACGSDLATGSFDALTYNVAGLPQGLSKSDPENNTPQISPLLNTYDLVLVQEDFSYHSELLSRASFPFRSEPKEGFTAFVNDGLNRLAEFSWVDFERVQWVECFGDANTGSGDCLAEKGFTWARMEPSEGVFIDIYNHHADAGGGPEDMAAREAGYTQLIEFIKTKSVGRAVIVAGDTNLHRTKPVDLALIDKLVEQVQVVDSCLDLGCPDEDRIDRFFYRSSDDLELTPSNWRVADEFVDPDGNALSDHKAVNVTFDWEAKE